MTKKETSSKVLYLGKSGGEMNAALNEDKYEKKIEIWIELIIKLCYGKKEDFWTWLFFRKTSFNGLKFD